LVLASGGAQIGAICACAFVSAPIWPVMMGCGLVPSGCDRSWRFRFVSDSFGSPAAGGWVRCAVCPGLLPASRMTRRRDGRGLAAAGWRPVLVASSAGSCGDCDGFCWRAFSAGRRLRCTGTVILWGAGRTSVA